MAMKGYSAFPKVPACWNLTIRLFIVICRTLVGGGSYPSTEKQSVYSTAPADLARLTQSPVDVLIVVKTKHPILVIEFEIVTSAGSVLFPFIFPHGLILNTKDYVKCMDELGLTRIEKVTSKRFLHALQIAEPNASCQKNSASTSLLTSVRLSLRIAFLLIILYVRIWAWDRKKSAQNQIWIESKENSSFN